MKDLYLAIVLAPLVAAIIAGLFGRRIGRAGAHTVTILGVATAFALSGWTLAGLVGGSIEPFNELVEVLICHRDSDTYNLAAKVMHCASLRSKCSERLSEYYHKRVCRAKREPQVQRQSATS